MRNHEIVLLKGDGIGPEIIGVTKRLLEEVSKKNDFKLNFSEHLIGGSAIEETGFPLPPDTLEACNKSDATLLSAIGDPKYDSFPRDQRPETGLLALRSGMNLFANIRPVKTIPSLINASTLKPEIVSGIDLIVVRELTGGIYFGEPKGKVKTDSGERAFNTMTYSRNEINRISQVAFEIAKDRKLKICSVDKANVLEVSQLWRDEVNSFITKFPEIEVSHLYIDNASMQLIKDPSQFDVILTGNLFGDILSDEAAMLTGSIGMLPSASINTKGPGLFEPVHGSAPDIAGSNKANPIAMVLSAAMMLDIGLNEKKAAKDIESCVNKVLDAGFRTIDIMSNSCTELGCQEMGEELIKAL